MKTGKCRQIKYPPNGRSLRIRFGFRLLKISTAAAGDWMAGGEKPARAAKVQVKTLSAATSAATEAIGAKIVAGRAGFKPSCSATGTITTRGIRSANISTF